MSVMSDERIIAILEEMRDLQKQSAENFKIAMAKQQEAIDTQKSTVKRARTLLGVIGVLIAFLFVLPFFYWATSWGLRCFLR